MSSAWISQIGVLLLGFVTLPILLNHLGTELYAILAIITSLSGWMAMCDFGLSFSLQNYVSEKKAHGHSYDSYIQSVAIISLVLFVIFTIILILIASCIGHVVLGKFYFLNSNQIYWLILIAGILAMLSTFTNNSLRIIHAEGYGWVGASFGIPFAVATLIGYLVLSRFSLGDYTLHWFIVATALPQILVKLIFWVRVLGRTSFNGPWSSLVHAGQDLVKRGLGFAFASLAGMLTLQIDYFALAHFASHDVRGIAIYNLLNKFLGLLLVFYSTLLFSLWPVCSERLAKGDWNGVADMMHRYIGMGMLLIVIGSAGFWLFQDLIFTILHIREAIHIPNGLIFLFMGYLMIRVWTDTFTTLLQSNNHLGIFYYIVPLQAAISICGMILMVPKFGVPGVLYAMILSFLLTVTWALPLKYYRLAKQLSRSRAP